MKNGRFCCICNSAFASQQTRNISQVSDLLSKDDKERLAKAHPELDISQLRVHTAPCWNDGRVSATQLTDRLISYFAPRKPELGLSGARSPLGHRQVN